MTRTAYPADSAATVLADRMEAVAGHLHTYPHLAPVAVSPSSDTETRCQIYGAPEPAALIAWADTLDWVTVTVKVINNQSFVYVRGETDTGHAVEVWDTVPCLHNTYDTGAAGPVPISTKVLRQFIRTHLGEPLTRHPDPEAAHELADPAEQAGTVSSVTTEEGVQVSVRWFLLHATEDRTSPVVVVSVGGQEALLTLDQADQLGEDVHGATLLASKAHVASGGAR